MARTNAPLLNGYAPSWADIVVRATPTGAPIIEVDDIQALDVSTTIEVGEQRIGGRVVRRTTGSQTIDGSMVLYRSGYQTFIDELSKNAPLRQSIRRIGLVEFNMTVQHRPPGAPIVYEFRLKGVRYLGNEKSGSEGSDAELVTIPLSIIEHLDVNSLGEEVSAL